MLLASLSSLFLPREGSRKVFVRQRHLKRRGTGSLMGLEFPLKWVGPRKKVPWKKRTGRSSVLPTRL